MDKKTGVIIILSAIILCLLVWIIGFRNPDYREIKRRLDSSLERNTIIEESAGRLQTANQKLIGELGTERDISAGLQEANQKLEQLNSESEQRDRQQREAIDRIISGDTDIDNAISGAEEGIDSALRRLDQLTAPE